MGRTVSLVNLGRTRYEDCLALQRELQSERRDDTTGDWLLLTEHEPVITLGRGHPEPDLRVARESIEQQGIPIVQTERGGDITYHGPGQLIAYGIIDLRAWNLGVIDYVDALERAVIETLQHWGVVAGQRPGCRGVWAGNRKVASLGINVRRWVTMHGIALNVAPQMADFDLINPCGMAGVEMTSLAAESGIPLTVADVVPLFTSAFEHQLGCALAPGRLP